MITTYIDKKRKDGKYAVRHHFAGSGSTVRKIMGRAEIEAWIEKNQASGVSFHVVGAL